MRRGSEARRARRQRALPRREADMQHWIERAETAPEGSDLQREAEKAAAKAMAECQTLRHRLGIA